MTTRSRFLATFSSVGAVAGVLPGPRAMAAETYTLRMSIPLAMNTYQWNGSVRFAQAVQRRSAGRVKIEIYPNGSLANQTDSITGLPTGLVDIAIQSSVFFEPMAPRWAVLDLPFIFKDTPAVRRVLDASIGDELFADLTPKGIVGLAWTGGGLRQFETVPRGITKPEDLKGMRIRIQNAPIALAMVKALGAIPTVIDFTEVYTAMQQRTVDGLETVLDSVAAAKLDNIIKYVAMTNHVFSLDPLVIAQRKLAEMPSDLQRIIREEARNANPVFWTGQASDDDEAAAAFKKKGIIFTQVDHAAFRRLMDPVYASVQAKVGGNLIDRIAKAGAS